MLEPLTLVLGGARSGKSALAEALVRAAAARPVYIATAEARDDERRARIAAHRAARGPQWRSIEAPHDPAAALAAAQPGEAVLLDCATLWLSNRMLADADLGAEVARLLQALEACAAPVVVVSNEVGCSVVPENALARRFRDEQGRLNQALAARAGCAVLMAAGLPLRLKGRLPEAVG